MPSNADPTRPDIFECTQCGECCKGYGGTYVSEADIARIAAFLDESPETVIRNYCRASGRRRLIGQADNGYCVFAKDGRCAIHPVKPRMCRRWPYLPSILVDVSNWHAMAKACPGMRIDVADEWIRRCVRDYLAVEAGEGDG